MRNSFFLSLFLIFFSSINSIAQGPLDGYFNGKKVLDLALGAGVQTSNSYFLASGPIEYGRTLPIISLFAKYGLTDKIDIVGSLPIINNQFQDIGLYAKYKLIDASIGGKKLTIAPGLGFSTPVLNYDTEIKNAIGQRATQFHGHLIGQIPLFNTFSMQVQGTYHYALDPVPSSWNASAKLIYIKNSWYFDLWYEYQQGLGDITYLGQLPYDSFREFTVDYNRVGGVIFKGLKNNWGTFVNASQIINGLDTFNATTIMVGVTKKLDYNKK